MKVVKREQLPIKAPVGATVIAWLVCSHDGSPLWLWGALGVIVLLLWAVWGYQIWNEESAEVEFKK